MLAADSGVAVTEVGGAVAATQAACEQADRSTGLVATEPAAKNASENHKASLDSSSAARSFARSIIFLDDQITDADVLKNAASNDAEIVLLDRSSPLMDQLQSVLGAREGIREIHLVTHGASGKLYLGDQVFDATALTQHSVELQQMMRGCVPGADFLIYGCDVGAGSAGRDFVRQWARVTGLDVAASNNRTGSRIGSDWILENRVGVIEASVAFDSAGRNKFRTTLNVTINASGSTGEEIAQLLIDDNVVAQWNVSTEDSEFVFESDQALQADQVKIRFANDLYLPDQSIDRNLMVDYIQIDGVRFESEDERTYSTGGWDPQMGVTEGFGLGETLYTGGSFQFDADEPSGGLQFAGREWKVEPGTSATVDNGFRVTADGSDGVAWAGLDLKESQRYRFFVTGNTRSLDGQFSTEIGQAVVGVDFYDSMGVEIGESIIELNNSGFPFSDINFVTPENTAYGTLFVWAENTADGNNAVTDLSDIVISEVPNDFQPPTVEFLNDGLVVTEPTGRIELRARFTDENDILGGGLATLNITEPDGRVRGASGSFENSAQLNDRTLRVSYDPDPSNSTITAANNGVYTVGVQGGFVGAIRDSAGNQVETQTIGTFTIDLPGETTQAPPEARLSALSEQSISGISPPQFTVEVSGGSGNVQSPNLDEAIRIVGPSGYDQPAIFTNASSFGTLRASYNFDTDGDPPLVPGLYFIVINENAFLDSNGNAVPARVIGSIQLVA